MEDWVSSRWFAAKTSVRGIPYPGKLGRAVLIFVIGSTLAFPYFSALGAEEFHGDETHWTTSSQEAFRLVSSGELFDA
ncbi:MAG: hypothetical protein EB140_16450, partial [Proteobacteria bacterium]|nr:hypothetical protein [Pseudomonadota bacterium]